MTQGNEQVQWPPEDILMTAQEIVWSGYVAGVILPAVTIWNDMTTYLQEQPPESFMFLRSSREVRTQWGVTQTAHNRPTGRRAKITAAIETETALSALPGSPETVAAVKRLEEMDSNPNPSWPTYHRKAIIPAQMLLGEYPAFILPVARECNMLDIRIHVSTVAGSERDLLRGMTSRDHRTRVVRGDDLNTRVTNTSPAMFRPREGLRYLRTAMEERVAGGRLRVPEGDFEVAQAAAEEVLRSTLPWHIGDGLKEVEQARLALSGQLLDGPQL